VIVVDASALVKYLLREEGWEEASRYVRTMKPLYSLDHVLKEVANVIWKDASTRKVITSKFAMRLYDLVERLIDSQVIILENELKHLKRAIEIALEHNITVYDSLYIAQAEKYGEILTSDEKQGEVARKLGIRVHKV